LRFKSDDFFCQKSCDLNRSSLYFSLAFYIRNIQHEHTQFETVLVNDLFIICLFVWDSTLFWTYKTVNTVSRHTTNMVVTVQFKILHFLADFTGSGTFIQADKFRYFITAGFLEILSKRTAAGCIILNNKKLSWCWQQARRVY